MAESAISVFFDRLWEICLEYRIMRNDISTKEQHKIGYYSRGKRGSIRRNFLGILCNVI